MTCVPPTTIAEFTKLKTLWRCLLVFRCHVITAFTFRALKHNIVACHDLYFLMLRSLMLGVEVEPLSLNDVSDSASANRPPTFSDRKP